MHPELICNCAVCSKELSGNPDNIIKYSDDPDLLRRHFLTVRKEEINSIESGKIDDLLAELDVTYNTYHPSISQLPNPDSMLPTATMQGLDYLQSWRDGISP